MWKGTTEESARRGTFKFLHYGGLGIYLIQRYLKTDALRWLDATWEGVKDEGRGQRAVANGRAIWVFISGDGWARRGVAT